MLNKVILQGRLTRDPESFATQSGTSFCKFSLDSNRKFKDREDVYFAECLAFGKLGETCLRYLRKGSEIIIVGKISTNKWQDRATGQERSKDVITLDEMEFAGGGGGGGQQQYQQPYQQQQQQQQYQQHAAQPPRFAPNSGQQQGFQQPQQPAAQGDQQAMPEGDAGDDIPF